MSNRNGRYREHRIGSGLGRHLGQSASDTAVIERLASDAYHVNGGIYFTEKQLKTMPWQARELIESEARRLYGPRRRNG